MFSNVENIYRNSCLLITPILVYFYNKNKLDPKCMCFIPRLKKINQLPLVIYSRCMFLTQKTKQNNHIHVFSKVLQLLDI